MKRVIYFFLLGIATIALGIFMWARPNTFVNVIAVAFSLYLAFSGFKSLFFYFKLKNKSSKAISNSVLIKALVNLVIGILSMVIIFTKKEAVLNFLVYLIAADLIVSSLVDLVDFFMIRKAKLELVYSSLSLQAALGLVFGILFIVFPQFVGHAGLTIIAVIFIAIGIIISCYAAHLYLLTKALKSQKTASEVYEATAEFEEANE